jgi:hypothetical protein
LSRTIGDGGQPGMCRSTGTTAETPPTQARSCRVPPPSRAVSYGHHPLRVGRRQVGALERFAHVRGDRTGHQQHIGMARRGDEAQAESLEVIEHVAERVDLELAPVAGPRIDLADRERSPEPPARGLIHARGQLGNRRVIARGWSPASGPCTRLFNSSLRMPSHPRGRGPHRSN